MWSWVKEEQIKRENLNKFSLDEHQDGRFAWHLVVKRATVAVSDNLLSSSEETQINADDLRSATLLVRDKCGKTAVQVAQRGGRIMALRRLLDWQKSAPKSR